MTEPILNEHIENAVLLEEYESAVFNMIIALNSQNSEHLFQPEVSVERKTRIFTFLVFLINVIDKVKNYEKSQNFAISTLQRKQRIDPHNHTFLSDIFIDPEFIKKAKKIEEFIVDLARSTAILQQFSEYQKQKAEALFSKN